MFIKGVAFDNFPVKMVSDADFNTPEEGKSPTIVISKDGTTFQAVTNTPSEISRGWYIIDLTADEMDADVLIISATATDCAQNDYVIFPETE
jgi:hypothetical protein